MPGICISMCKKQTSTFILTQVPERQASEIPKIEIVDITEPSNRQNHQSTPPKKAPDKEFPRKKTMPSTRKLPNIVMINVPMTIEPEKITPKKKAAQKDSILRVVQRGSKCHSRASRK